MHWLDWGSYSWKEKVKFENDQTLIVYFHFLLLVETGVSKNTKKAQKYLKCAADKGNGEAQYHLGMMIALTGCSMLICRTSVSD